MTTTEMAIRMRSLKVSSRTPEMEMELAALESELMRAPKPVRHAPRSTSPKAAAEKP